MTARKVIDFGHSATCWGRHFGMIRPIWRLARGFQALSGCQRAAFEHDEAAHVVGQVLHADLHARPHDADGAHQLATHAGVLAAEHMFDARPH